MKVLLCLIMILLFGEIQAQIFPMSSQLEEMRKARKPDSVYLGLQGIFEIDSNNRKSLMQDIENPKHLWYHLTYLSFYGDTVIIDQSPVSIYKKDTLYSASNGGFYTYLADIPANSKDTLKLDLSIVSCDYCPILVKKAEAVVVLDSKGEIYDPENRWIAVVAKGKFVINGYEFRRQE